MFKLRKEAFGVYSRFYLVKQDWTEIVLHDRLRKKLLRLCIYLFSIYYRKHFISHFIKWLLYINTTILRTKANSVLYLQLTQNHILLFYFSLSICIAVYSNGIIKKLLSNKWLGYISLKTFYEIIIMKVIKLIFIKHEAERLISAVGVFILLLW